MSEIELVSPLSPDECAARLREAIDRDGLLAWFGSKPVMGRVSDRSVRLRKRIGYNNSFQTCLSGTLEPHGEGTVFRGKAGTHPFVTAFVAVWFAGALLAGGALFVAAILGFVVGHDRPVVLIVPPLIAVLGVITVSVGRFLARGEERFLVAFVAEVLGAPHDVLGEPGAVAGQLRD